LAYVALWHGSTYAKFDGMTIPTKEPETVKRAIDLLLGYGQDMRNYGDWSSMTNDEKRNMIEKLKLALGKTGCNLSDGSQPAINAVIVELGKLQRNLK
jgi:hypothetical protein